MLGEREVVCSPMRQVDGVFEINGIFGLCVSNGEQGKDGSGDTMTETYPLAEQAFGVDEGGSSAERSIDFVTKGGV
jgi:hypothetical protein